MSRKGTEDIANVSYIKAIDMAEGYTDAKVPVNVKNNSTEPVVLTVHMIDAPEDEYIQTTFYPGWNPEIVDEIKPDATVENIQIGL